MLTHDGFSQRELARHLGKEDFGGLVNSFIKTLVDAGYVARTGEVQRGGRKYQVTSPVGLVGFYSKFRKMKKLDTFIIGDSRDEIIEYLNKKGAIFCLTTALSQYSSYFTDPAVYAYLKKEDEYILEDEVKEFPKGRIVVNLYKFDLDDSIKEIEGKKITSEVRTIIDLYCENKAHEAADLVKQTW